MVNSHAATSRSTELSQSMSRRAPLITSTNIENQQVSNRTNSTNNTNQLQTFLLQNSINTTIQNLTEDDKEHSVISEFTYLLDKSKQLFNGLRDLPQYGHRNNQWQAYFGRTFDVYTRLWKFQQQHRHILESRMNLKRWQIGEIASKIGQLYYHYYLRTSESNYLFESYSFYQAIQTRNYYSKANKEEKPDLMVKKLRFYARFIVVSLLLKKTKQVRDLTKDLHRHIDEYCRVYDPPDQLEWQMVRNEISDFILADSVVTIDSSVSLKTVISNRLDVSQVPFFTETRTNRKSQQNNNLLSLQEILIIGNCQNQTKFSELSLDMFRMLQAVERETTSVVADLDANASKAITKDLNDKKLLDSEAGHSIIQRDNPHKYLLYKPSFSQLFTYLSAAFKDLPMHGVMLVYLSADGCESFSHGNSSRDGVTSAYEAGGLRTNSRREASSTTSNLNISANSNSLSRSQFRPDSSIKSGDSKEAHCVYPGDLYPFLRKPMVLIVDSSKSTSFQDIPNMFGQPFVGLFSPTMLPHGFHVNQDTNGSIFTLFLTNPLFGFCSICGVDELSSDVFYKAQHLIRVILTDIAKSFHRSKSVDQVFLQIGNDDFLRVFLLRFVFCYYALRLHKAFKGSDYYPCSQPNITFDIIENVQIQRTVIELASCMSANQLFLMPEE